MPASISSFRVPPVTSPSLSSLPGQLIAGLDIDRAGFLVDDVLGDVAANDLVEGTSSLGDLPSSIIFLTARGVTFLPASAITSPGLGVDEVIVGRVPRMRSGKNFVTQPLFFFAACRSTVS
jgi:hypothetical protein